MNAVIVGCGKVGSELAKTLVNDGHNVSIIDNSQRSLDSISEELDVMTILGNGTNLELLKEAGVENADIFIAVSTSDEVNLLSCLSQNRFRNARRSRESATRFISDRQISSRPSWGFPRSSTRNFWQLQKSTIFSSSRRSAGSMCLKERMWSFPRCM